MIRTGATVVIVCISAMAFGQNNHRVLTFEEAIKIALRNSVTLNQQRNNLELNQMQKTSSIASIAPNVSATLSASRFDGNSFNPNAGVVVNGVRDNISGSISANMNLFSGFNRLNLIKQASTNLDAQSNFVHRTSQDVMNTVANQYLQVMLDVELLRIAIENFGALSKQLEQTKEQVRVGSRSPVDEYNQDALTKGAELRMVQAEITLNNDKALLSQTLLLDALEEFDVEKPSWDVNKLGNEAQSSEELANQAKLHRGDYLRAAKQETAQKYAMRAAVGNMVPSLIAFFNYGSAYNFQRGVPDSSLVSIPNTQVVVDPTQPSGYGLQTTTTSRWSRSEEQRSFNDQFRFDNVYKQYGFQLSIPLFNGFQNRTAHMQQRTLYENAKLNRRNVEFQIKNDVVRANRNFEGAKKAFAVTVDQLKSAEVAFSLETERYNLGVTNFVDFINANRVFVQAQTDKAQAEYRLLFQKVLLDYAVGTLKIEDIQP
ncbi:MAG: TolC family protein [Bacteroidetes bacterium]|nr:TolC family protein [Bacteroidota bacterium]